jgi:hypothetical protein
MEIIASEGLSLNPLMESGRSHKDISAKDTFSLLSSQSFMESVVSFVLPITDRKGYIRKSHSLIIRSSQ